MAQREENDEEPTRVEPCIEPELTRNLLQFRQNDGQPKRITMETAKAASELLRLFILEARSRASIEAECDNEGAGDEAEFKQDKNGNDLVIIRADHITKIAAELLMDFS